MILTTNMRQLMGDTPEPLWARRGAEVRAAAARDYSIQINQARPLGGDYLQMSADVTRSTKAGVYEFCQASAVVAVTLQPNDLPLYFSDHVLEMVRANFPHFKADLTDMPPHSIVEVCNQIGLAILRHNPIVTKNDPDPFYRESDKDRQEKILRDEVWLEMEQQKDAQEKEAARAVTGLWE